jgi:hypothetical protein
MEFMPVHHHQAFDSSVLTAVPMVVFDHSAGKGDHSVQRLGYGNPDVR